MITSVCEGAIDKIACMIAVNAAQDAQNYSIKLIAISCFSLIGLVSYLIIKGNKQHPQESIQKEIHKPDVHIHKKEIHRVPEPTWKKIADAGLAGLAFGVGVYTATGIMDFTMKFVYSIFSKNSTKGQRV